MHEFNKWSTPSVTERKRRNKPDNIRTILSEIGFNVSYNITTSNSSGAIIVGNQEFAECIPPI